MTAVTEPLRLRQPKAQNSKGDIMIQVDYGKYLDDQKGWAEILAEKAELDNGDTDREYALLEIMAINQPVGTFSETELTY
jgi:hypothetical protein